MSTLCNAVDTLDRERAALELLALARELLLLDRGYEAAFPSAMASAASQGGLGTAIERVLRRDRSRSWLPSTLGAAIQRLVEPPVIAPGESADGASEPDLSVVDEIIRFVIRGAHARSPAMLLLAQRTWVFGDEADVAAPLAGALGAATRRNEATAALVHLSILRADGGRLDEAVRLVSAAATLLPHRLPVRFTAGLYAAAAGDAASAGRHLQAAARLGTFSERRRRMAAVPRQLQALARRGCLRGGDVRAHTCEIMTWMAEASGEGRAHEAVA